MAGGNHHGSLVVVGETGVFVTGPSGAGKTALALALLRHGAACGFFARMVGDDQLFLSAENGRLVGRAAETIGGLAEARGFGPAPIAHENCAVIDLVVQLVPAAVAPRVDEHMQVVLAGVPLPCLKLAERDPQGAVLAVAARLGLPPFA
ncbi:HPr kinase/phosphorylase [Nitratireductor sp. GCM10026969]|uniref:HPr kinase/phosphorylase n=1 Tax=Nitratireductor sp. GCM10026969 TaxID=3252645 RepID=UPI00361781AB